MPTEPGAPDAYAYRPARAFSAGTDYRDKSAGLNQRKPPALQRFRRGNGSEAERVSQLVWKLQIPTRRGEDRTRDVEEHGNAYQQLCDIRSSCDIRERRQDGEKAPARKAQLQLLIRRHIQHRSIVIRLSDENVITVE